MYICHLIGVLVGAVDYKPRLSETLCFVCGRLTHPAHFLLISPRLSLHPCEVAHCLGQPAESFIKGCLLKVARTATSPCYYSFSSTAPTTTATNMNTLQRIHCSDNAGKSLSKSLCCCCKATDGRMPAQMVLTVYCERSFC